MTSVYRLKVEKLPGTVTALRAAQVVASSDKVRLMRETRLPDTLYFPRDALTVRLIPSDYRTFCPFKGTASYWHTVVDGKTLTNTVWSYEQALSDALAIENLYGLMPVLIDHYEYSAGAPAPSDDGDLCGALVNWIVRDAAQCPDGMTLTRELAERLLAQRIDICRLGVLLWSLHPQTAGVQYIWHRDQLNITVRRPDYSMLSTPQFANSPLRYVTAGLGGVRQPLNVRETEFQFPVLDDLQRQGVSDYVAMPLPFSDGRTNVLTLATDHPEGFSTASLGHIFECSFAVSRYYEVFTQRANTVALLNTYVGRRAGSRVLGGHIRRGDGDSIKAAILFCDLRGSTRLAETLPTDDYLTLLNGFFEQVSAAVVEHEGEVLKFIGDAVLAIFPQNTGAPDARQRSAAAAFAIPEAVRTLDCGHDLVCAIGLSFGVVTYGNIGAPDRLDFTVVGTAANIAARLSDLAKIQSRFVLMSGEVAEVLTGVERLGAFELHNIAKPVEVFTRSER